LGGETLLNVEPVYQILDALGERCYKNLLYTNGDSLTYDILKSLKDRKVKIVLNPTYDSLSTVKDKISLVKEVCGGASLSVALTAYNMSRLPELVRLAIKHNIHIRMNRLYEGGSDKSYLDEYKQQMVRALGLLLRAVPMWPNYIVDCIYVTWIGSENPYLCGKDIVTIDVDGTIRSCIADKTSRIGSIFTENNFKYPQRHDASNYEECQSCKWLLWCQGGCPYTSKVITGLYGITKTPFCSAYKAIFPILFELTRRWMVHEVQ